MTYDDVEYNNPPPPPSAETVFAGVLEYTFAETARLRRIAERRRDQLEELEKQYGGLQHKYQKALRDEEEVRDEVRRATGLVERAKAEVVLAEARTERYRAAWKSTKRRAKPLRRRPSWTRASLDR